MKTLFLIIVFVSIVSGLRCPSRWSMYKSNCYKYFSQAKPYWDASNFCRQQLFHTTNTERRYSELVSIHDHGENRFINTLAPNRRNFFIGLYHNINEGRRTWHWTDGTPLDYTNWAPGQPDPSHQMFGAMWNEHTPSKWDDSTWSALPFVCKVPANECLMSPDETAHDASGDAEICKNGGILKNEGCVCHTPYECIDCSWYNGCSSNPCQNGGRCVNHHHHYSCQCDEGLTGEHCELYAGCLTLPCYNNGSCTVDADKAFHICVCPENYTGVMCQTYIGHCKENPCENGGSCHSISVSPFYVCQCKPPHLGSRCTTTIYDCISNPCLNNGTCIPNVKNDGISCLCPSDYTGSTCGLLKQTSPAVYSNTSNAGLKTALIMVTAVMSITIILLIAYVCRIRRRSKMPSDFTSFVGFKNVE